MAGEESAVRDSTAGAHLGGEIMRKSSAYVNPENPLNLRPNEAVAANSGPSASQPASQLQSSQCVFDSKQNAVSRGSTAPPPPTME